MLITIGIIVVVLIIIGINKRVEDGEITPKEAEKLSVKNLGGGFTKGLNELNHGLDQLNSYLDIVNIKLELKGFPTSCKLARLNLESILKSTKDNVNKYPKVTSRLYRNKTRSNDSFDIDYGEMKKSILLLPIDEQEQYISMIEEAYIPYFEKLTELKNLLENDIYHPAFYAANNEYGSESLLRLLKMDAASFKKSNNNKIQSKNTKSKLKR